MLAIITILSLAFALVSGTPKQIVETTTINDHAYFLNPTHSLDSFLATKLASSALWFGMTLNSAPNVLFDYMWDNTDFSVGTNWKSFFGNDAQLCAEIENIVTFYNAHGITLALKDLVRAHFIYEAEAALYPFMKYIHGGVRDQDTPLYIPVCEAVQTGGVYDDGTASLAQNLLPLQYVPSRPHYHHYYEYRSLLENVTLPELRNIRTGPSCSTLVVILDDGTLGMIRSNEHFPDYFLGSLSGIQIMRDEAVILKHTWGPRQHRFSVQNYPGVLTGFDAWNDDLFITVNTRYIGNTDPVEVYFRAAPQYGGFVNPLALMRIAARDCHTLECARAILGTTPITMGIYFTIFTQDRAVIIARNATGTEAETWIDVNDENSPQYIYQPNCDTWRVGCQQCDFRYSAVAAQMATAVLGRRIETKQQLEQWAFSNGNGYPVHSEWTVHLGVGQWTQQHRLKFDLYRSTCSSMLMPEAGMPLSCSTCTVEAWEDQFPGPIPPTNITAEQAAGLLCSPITHTCAKQCSNGCNEATGTCF